jgi:ABC-type uncharacterized transport system permease subunit
MMKNMITKNLFVAQTFFSKKLRSITLQTAVFVMPFLIYGIFLWIYDVNPFQLYASMFTSSFGNLYGFGEVLIKSTPIILTGLAAALPAKAGMINVGGEGQLAIGALFATWCAVFYLNDAPSWWGLPALIIAGAFGGAIWAGVTALLKVKGNMNETISSLLLNYVAFFTIGFFLQGILKDPDSFNWPFSAEISSALRLPNMEGTRLHIGILISVALAILVWFMLSKTRLGFRIRVLGRNIFAAERAGFQVSHMQFWVLVAAGAIAGIAGMIELTGIEGRLRPTTGATYGYLGFLAAWMAWNHPLRLIISALLLGMISVTGNTLQMNSGLPSSSVNILMALVLLFLLGSRRWIKS